MLDRFELFSDALLHAFSFSKRIAHHARSFGVTPHKFIWMDENLVLGDASNHIDEDTTWLVSRSADFKLRYHPGEVVQMRIRIALGILISTWGAAASAHSPADPNWKPEPLSMATMIGLNGFLCSEVIRSTRLKKADMYEVECKTGSGKSKSTYIFDAKTGKVWAPS